MHSFIEIVLWNDDQYEEPYSDSRETYVSPSICSDTSLHNTLLDHRRNRLRIQILYKRIHSRYWSYKNSNIPALFIMGQDYAFLVSKQSRFRYYVWWINNVGPVNKIRKMYEISRDFMRFCVRIAVTMFNYPLTSTIAK